MAVLKIACGMLLVVLACGEAKYVSDIYGNTVVQDKSTGFHVFELPGYSVGETSSVLIGIALLICATYLCFKLGLGMVAIVTVAQKIPVSEEWVQPKLVTQQPVQMVPRQ